jgi:uncharacterized protein YxjI
MGGQLMPERGCRSASMLLSAMRMNNSEKGPKSFNLEDGPIDIRGPMICDGCGLELPDESSYCWKCGAKFERPAHAPTGSQAGIWHQDFYRIRRKVLAVGNKYYIEDRQGGLLGFSMKKLFRIQDDIRIFSDEGMADELFRVQQENIVDDWGTWAVIDSGSGTCVGKMKRRYLSNFGADEYALLGPDNQPLGRVVEPSGRGLARKYIPFGGLMPEHVNVEYLGRQIAEVRQQFKVIGDTWEVECHSIPQEFDRRTLLTAMLIMGMVERREEGGFRITSSSE